MPNRQAMQYSGCLVPAYWPGAKTGRPDERRRWRSILLGSDTCGLAQRQLIAAGADRVYLGDAAELRCVSKRTLLHRSSPDSRQWKISPKSCCSHRQPIGRELAPLVAGRLKTGLTAHCIDLVLDEYGVLQQKIPAYGGMLTIICPRKTSPDGHGSQGGFPQSQTGRGDRSGEIIPITLPAQIPGRLKTLEVVYEAPRGVPLESASIVVAGGAGAGGKAWMVRNSGAG